MYIYMIYVVLKSVSADGVPETHPILAYTEQSIKRTHSYSFPKQLKKCIITRSL